MQNQNQTQGGQGFGGYGQGQSSGQGFGGYGGYGQNFGGSQADDFEIAEFWYIPGQEEQGQGQSQGQGQGQTSGLQGQQRQGSRGRRMMQRGPHTGKGPKRSDQHMDDEVRRKLTQHGNLDASKVDVKVNDGVVTLTGSVASRQDKREAENVADTVPGVKDVNNQLTIQSNSSQNASESKSASK